MKKGRYAHVQIGETGGGLGNYILALLDVYEWETMFCSFSWTMRESCVFDTIVNQVGEHAIPYIFEQAEKRWAETDRQLGFGMAQHLLMAEITDINPLDDNAVKREDGWDKFSVRNVERCWRQWAKEHKYIKDDLIEEPASG